MGKKLDPYQKTKDKNVTFNDELSSTFFSVFSYLDRTVLLASEHAQDQTKLGLNSIFALDLLVNLAYILEIDMDGLMSPCHIVVRKKLHIYTHAMKERNKVHKSI